MPKVMCAIGSLPDSYKKMYLKYGWEVTEDIHEADVIQFTGGADVHPKHYREDLHPKSFTQEGRDRMEITVFHEAVALGKPMVGICRGAQLLNVLGGGRLYQDVNHHAIFGKHPAIDLVTNERIDVTSTHHQMMRPGRYGKVFLVTHALATLKESMVNGIITDCSDDKVDVEGVYYPKIKALCIQGHPEKTVSEHDEFQDYFFSVLTRYLGF